MSKYAKKLGDDKSYKRAKTTFQEQLTSEQIAEKLQGYVKVDDIAEVPLNTHLRYFKTEADGTQSFRLGGFLHNKKDADRFVMLSNGKSVWSVQVNTAVFFKKLSQKDEIESIHKLYKKKLAEKDAKIKKLVKYIKTNMAVKNASAQPKYQNKPTNPTNHAINYANRAILNRAIAGSKSSKKPQR